jgi:hypothetical protein
MLGRLEGWSSGKRLRKHTRDCLSPQRTVRSRPVTTPCFTQSFANFLTLIHGRSTVRRSSEKKMKPSLLGYPLLTVLLLHGAAGNFIRDPKCPAATPQLPAACAGRRSNCWSPGVRDLDCPGSGLCCYDGCANTCVGGPAGPPPQPLAR